MSQLTKKNAAERKAKEDKDSTKQIKQKSQDAAPKQNFNTKESKKKVDERELRRMLKDSETTVEQLTRHNSDLLLEREKDQIEMQKLLEENIKLNQSDEQSKNLKEELEKIKQLLIQNESEITRLKEESVDLQRRHNNDLLLEQEKHQIEMQKLQEENTKFSQSEEENKNLKDALEKMKALFTQKESETTRLKEEIDNLQRSMSRASSASIVSVRGVGSASAVRREDTDLIPETQKHQLELQKLQAENTNHDQSDEENKIMKKETTDEARGLEDDSHQQDRHEAETTPEAIKQPDEIQPELSLIRKDQHVQKMREKFTKLERGHNLQDDKAQERQGNNSRNLSPTTKTSVMNVNYRTDFQTERENKEDDTERSDDRSKLNELEKNPGKEFPAERNDNDDHTARSDERRKWNESVKDHGLSQVRNDEAGEERKRILKAERRTENLHKEAGTEDKNKQKIEELEVRVKELTEEKNTLLNRLSQVKNDEAGEERKRILKAERRTENLHKEAGAEDKNKQKIEELEVRVKELTEEKNTLLNRLSEIGAMKMKDNNPNVTDLSDANRPEKLVEQFSELYDNEWTDAYEHLTKTQGKQLKQPVKLLLQVLKEAYGICLSSTKESVKTLRKAILSYAGLSDEDSSELELQKIEKKMWEYRTKKSQCNVIRIKEEVKQKFRNQHEQFETDISNTMTLYIDGCVRICWFMCIKNPPMHLDFGESEESTTTNNSKPGISHFDTSKFISYTKSGDYVEYIVWPAVYLHEGGPIMRKGVAQGSHA